MEHFLTKMTKSAPFVLDFATFSERDFRLAQYQVFPWWNSRKWKVKIAFWKHCVSQCKWSTFWPKWPKSALILLDFATFSERDFRLAQYQVSPWGNSRKWKVKIAFWNHYVFQCKWSTFWPKWSKSAKILLVFQTFSGREFRHAQHWVGHMEYLTFWDAKMA